MPRWLASHMSPAKHAPSTHVHFSVPGVQPSTHVPALHSRPASHPPPLVQLQPSEPIAQPSVHSPASQTSPPSHPPPSVHGHPRAPTMHDSVVVKSASLVLAGSVESVADPLADSVEWVGGLLQATKASTRAVRHAAVMRAVVSRAQTLAAKLVGVPSV